MAGSVDAGGKPESAFAPLDPRGARGRVVAAVLVGAVTTLLLDRVCSLTTRIVAGWDAGALALIGLSWAIIARADADETRRRAAAEDPGRTVVWLVVLLASAFSVFAGTMLLRQARLLAPGDGGPLVAIAVVAVTAAWVLTHTAYTLRYAHLYYRDDDEGVGGLEFPGGRPPSDYDFAYFAFTVGMCFQVSDVVITSPVIRRHVLFHAMVSFAYNTTIIALALNLMFGLLG